MGATNCRLNAIKCAVDQTYHTPSSSNRQFQRCPGAKLVHMCYRKSCPSVPGNSAYRQFRSLTDADRSSRERVETRAPARPERSSLSILTLILAVFLFSGLGTFVYYETRTSSPATPSIEESKDLLGTCKNYSGVVWTISKEDLITQLAPRKAD